MALRLFINTPIKVIVFILSILSSFYIAYNYTQPGYEKLFLLPISYGIVFTFFIAPVLFKRTNMFLTVFAIISFLRYLILPTLIVLSQWYGGRSVVPPLSTSYNLALEMMIFELITVSIAIFFIFKRKNIKENVISKEVIVPKSKAVYLFFVIFSLFLLLINPEALRSFAFIIPTESMQDFGTGSFLVTFTTYCLITSKYILFLLVISYFYKLYLKNNSVIYIWLSLIVVLMNIFIIFGDNRSDFIITAIVSILLFYKLYPKKSKVPIIIVAIFIILITSFITAHRNSVSYTGGENPLVDLTDTLQVYLGGPYNVAIATEVAENNPESRNLGNLMYDLLRPAIGINILIKNLEGFEFSNYLFNYRIYFSEHTAQIMPMIGQGFFYFGFMFSPLIMIAFLFLVRYLVKVVQKQNRIELVFFLSIPITRIGFAMGQNAGILINDITFFLLLNLFVYYLNNKIIFKKKSNSVRKG